MKMLKMAALTVSLFGLMSCAHYGSGKSCETKTHCKTKAKKECCKKKDGAKKDCGKACKKKEDKKA